jgi:hypothetical protein
MRADLAFSADELRVIFEDVLRIAPWEWWRQRDKELRDRKRNNPYLADYYDERHFLERALVHAIQYNRATDTYPSLSGDAEIRYCQLYSFLQAVVRTHDSLSVRAQRRLRRSLKNGLKGLNGLNQIALEMAVAVHLWDSDFDVEFTDMENPGQFDLLATSKGMALEVECRTVGGDVGRFDRYRMPELLQHCHLAIEMCLARGGGTIIRIRPPAAPSDRGNYLKGVAALAIDAARRDLSHDAGDLAAVALTRFQLHESPFKGEHGPTQAELTSFLRRLSNDPAPYAMSAYRSKGAAVVVTIESEKHDKVVDSIYRSLKATADSKFTGSRPALLAVRLSDFTTRQLRALVAQHERGLVALANQLFAGRNHRHLYGVVFLASTGIIADKSFPVLQPATVQERGSVLLFRNGGHPLAGDPRLNVTTLFFDSGGASPEAAQ